MPEQQHAGAYGCVCGVLLLLVCCGLTCADQVHAVLGVAPRPHDVDLHASVLA